MEEKSQLPSYEGVMAELTAWLVAKKWTIISHLQHTGNVFVQPRPCASVPPRSLHKVLQQDELIWEETQAKIFLQNLQHDI